MWQVASQQVIYAARQPAADLCVLLLVDRGIYIHGDLDAGMAQLRLYIFEVKHVGALHPAGHVMSQHVEQRLGHNYEKSWGTAGLEHPSPSNRNVCCIGGEFVGSGGTSPGSVP